MPNAGDISRGVRRFLLDVSAQGRVVPHDGPCGERVDAPCGNADFAPFRPAERLRSGLLLCHRCGSSYRLGEPAVCGRSLLP